jgi:YD repeat-containing protein
MTAPDGTRTESLLNYGGGLSIFGFENPLTGMAYEERAYNSSSQMLRRSLTAWQVSGPQPGGFSGASRDPRVTTGVNLLLDTGGNALAATTTMQYDSDLNVISTNHYDYASVDSATAQTGAISSIPLGSLVRTEETTCLVNDTGIDATVRQSYRNRQLLGLPTSARVKNSSGAIVAQSSMSYDEAAYPLLSYGSVTGWVDPQTPYRGNPTTVSHWLNTTNSYLQTHAQFDQCGSVRNSWDAQGNQSQIEYSSAYAYAYPTLARTPVPDATGQHGATTALVTTSIYDFNTGLTTSTTDPNNVTTTFEYNDSLNRSTRTVRAAGTAVQSQTSVAYDDLNHLVTTTSDQNSYNDNALRAQVLYDGLGRTTETRQYEGGSNYIAAQTQYDALGRGFKTSHPFRPWNSETAVWTTSAFDALGRVVTITTPDSAVVSTSYSGNTVTVTDQAGKQRQSVSDGLGRLIQVYEDPAGLNYLTSYSYDPLDNLTTVSQGSQTRSFVYDSLKRLTSATNPESGTLSYSYDNSGNLLTKTDARSITATYSYDALNRAVTRSYSDGAPTVTYSYDSGAISNGKGRLASVSSSVASYSYSGYDAMGRATGGMQTIGSQNYSVEYSYDLAGHVLTQTYPSGRTVTNVYDNAGRTTSVTGNLGDGTNRTYSTGLSYSPFGGITREQFGTTTPLYHKTFYNVRGQMFDTRLSSVNDTWDWNRGRVILYYSSNHAWGGSGTDNNGNLLFAENWIPPANATLDQAESLREDSYTYDTLNRLSAVNESSLNIAGGGSWTSQFAQGYTYDRYGNRTINTGATWGGVNNKAFSVDSANNRLGVPSGQSGTMSYDAAGNLTTDTYTGEGTRTYDAENRMTQAWANGQWQTYTYDCDGRRVKRNVNGTETWQVYGLGGELLAEYAANAAASSPQKEYGYRNGQLLVTAEPSANITWLVTDQLGTPRMIADLSGSLSGISRHDYLPFGEELFATTGLRTTTNGYSQSDNVRQKFTQKERDNETGLDYFGARYYSSTQGRSTCKPAKLEPLYLHT